MSVKINNHFYSNYRLSKMFNTEVNATSLRGWDKFKEWTGFGDKGQTKKTIKAAIC